MHYSLYGGKYTNIPKTIRDPVIIKKLLKKMVLVPFFGWIPKKREHGNTYVPMVLYKGIWYRQ